jgi:hypothetical protein
MRNALGLLASLVLGCGLSVAQTSPEQRQEIVRLDAAVSSISQYCRGIEAFRHSHDPLLLASTVTDPIDSGHWRQYVTKAEWEKAGMPVPAALAWMRDGNIIAVRLAFDGADKTVNIADYCFREDGTTAKIAISAKRKNASSRLGIYAEVTVGREWFFGPGGIRIEIQGLEPGLLKAEKTGFVYIQPPQFRGVSQLPFIALLHSGI